MMTRIFKRIYILIFVVVTVFILTLLHILSFYSHQSYIQRDCAVVFGAAVWPTHFGPVASHALADRTLAAASLYEERSVECIVLSGADSIYGAHEVDIMTDLLLTVGVPIDAIELDRYGLDTRATVENLDSSRTYTLVSNDFHLSRIGLLAQRSGLEFSLHAAKYESGRYTKEYYFITREAVAFWYYFFTTLL